MSGNDTELERLFTLSLDLLCVATGDGYFLRVNPAFEQVLGYRQEDILSRSFLELVHPDDQAGTREAMEQLVAGEPVVDFLNRYRAADGSFRWLQWRSTPVDAQGKVYAVARDVTRERAAQDVIDHQSRELARSNAELEEFAYAASHDLQAPLRSIGNLVDWIREDLKDVPEGPRQHLEQLGEQVQRMRRLVEDLLTYSRSGTRTAEASRVDTAGLVAEVLKLLDPPATVTVVVAAADMPTLQASRVALEQVFRNLIGNAISHHDRPDGRVTVSARQTGRMWEFVIADDGPGIAPADRERIFQMFHRLTPDSGSGTGMGLALVKRILQRHGGRVWVEAGRPRGAEFHFTWPTRPGTP